MALSADFITYLKADFNAPKLRFDYDGVDKTAYLQSVGEIKRDINLMPGYVQVAVDNTDGTWDGFLTDDAALTKKGVLTLTLANLTGTTIAFYENTPSADTITDSKNRFIQTGFKAGMIINVDNSSGNDGDYTIDTVTPGTITLVGGDDLANEGVGANVTIKLKEELPLFSGYAIEASYNYDEKSVNINFRDRISLALERRLEYVAGGDVGAVWMNYYNIYGVKQDPHTVSEIVWTILTHDPVIAIMVFCDLDDTASTANVDIDYTSFLAWVADVDAVYDIGVVAEGQTCGDILMKIAQMTESVFWVGGEGKIKFMTGRTAGSYPLYTNEILTFPEMRVAMEDRVNSITCKWRYIPDNDTWVSDTSGVVVDSSNVGPASVPYTYTSDIIDDRSVFHNTTASAYAYMAARLLRTAAPPRYFTITTQLLGFSEDVRSDIALQDLYVGTYDNIPIQINEITYIPESWEVRMVGQYIWEFA
jgi:hypothetical protein